MKQLLRSIVPQPAKDALYAWREREIIPEINKLSIEDMGTQDGVPWVKLVDGYKFFGFAPTLKQQKLFARIKGKLPPIKDECFGVVYDIVSRYKAPRSLPGETFFTPSKYMPLRDPLNDFTLPAEERERVATTFRPNKGDTIVDVGAYLGHGTMRLAELVGKQGRVIAFETDPDILKILSLNLKENNLDQVTLIPKAAAAHVGEGAFFRKDGTVNSLHPGVLTNLGYENLEEIDVGIETVDHVLQEQGINQVDMVNITINGGEFDALSGMQKTLAQSDNVKITLAGWYYMPNQEKICDIVKPQLEQMGFEVMIGHLGRVLAFKK